MEDRLKRQIRRRLLFSPDNAVTEKALTKEEKRKVINQRFREKLKADPERYAEHKAYDTAWQKHYRLSLSEEKKAVAREKARLRNIAYRQRQKANKTTPSRPATRRDAKKLEEKREKNRISQQKRRKNMSSQKKRREREANLAYYHKKRAPQTMSHQTLPHLSSFQTSPRSTSFQTSPRSPPQPSSKPRSPPQPMSSPCSPPQPLTSTLPKPHRSTISRLKKRLGAGMLVTLKGLVKSVVRKDKSGLASVGITYRSPGKAQTPLKPKLPSPLKRKRDKDTCIAKRLLRRQSTSGLYYKKKKHASLVGSFFNLKSTFLPGKKGITNRLNVKKGLDKSIVQLHEDFVQQYGTLVSRATFFRHRPKNIVSFAKTPFRQCLCELCLNPMLKVKILNMLGWPKLETLKGLLLLTLCDGERRDCIARLCDVCGVTLIDEAVRSVQCSVSESVCWQRWERVNKKNGTRMDLVKKEGSLEDLVRELKWELRNLSMHDFTHRWQTKQFSALIGDLPVGWAVVVLDFAENYLCVQQDQPQSAYFGYSQVTVHPCVMYYRCPCGMRITDNWTFVSDVLLHGADMVHCISERILSFLQSVQISNVVFFSDGCASQYKSRLPFAYLQSYASFNINVHRCYFGARHGKNPSDALGGLLKQAASRSVRARKCTIQNAHELFSFASKNLSVFSSENMCTHMRRSYFLLEEQDILNSAITFNALHALRGTRQLHDILSTEEGLMVRNLSCFCLPCCAGDFHLCINKAHVDAFTLCDQFLPNTNLNNAFVSSPTPVGGLPAQVEHSGERTTFFSDVLVILSGCSSFDELYIAVKEISPALLQFPLPREYPFHSISSVGGLIDTHAMKHFAPMGIKHLFPLKTVGDGNCVPRSLSYHCFGHQDSHVEVRVRVVHEMVSNMMDYMCLSADDLSFLFCHSDQLSDSPESVFKLEALNTCKTSVYMGMWQLMAASNALNANIMSVYPSLGPSQYSSFYNRTLKSRQSSSLHVFSLFWTSTLEHEAVMPQDYWTANHVVPLMPRKIPMVVVSDI